MRPGVCVSVCLSESGEDEASLQQVALSQPNNGVTSWRAPTRLVSSMQGESSVFNPRLARSTKLCRLLIPRRNFSKPSHLHITGRPVACGVYFPPKWLHSSSGTVRHMNRRLLLRKSLYTAGRVEGCSTVSLNPYFHRN